MAKDPSRGVARDPLRRRLVGIVAALAAVAAVGFLLTRSMRSARAEPYHMEAQGLRNWTLAVHATSSPRDPVLVLEPPQGVPGRLFDQVFHRAMESMSAAPFAGIPLLLRDEVDRAFAGRVSDEQLLAAARAAGLGAVTVSPRCMAYRRISNARGAQQLYFVVFDMPAFARFREQLSVTLGLGAAAGWDPAALSPVMFVALADSTLDRWLPVRADPARDCVAPIVTAAR
jgi:hypothetical protein